MRRAGRGCRRGLNRTGLLQSAIRYRIAAQRLLDTQSSLARLRQKVHWLEPQQIPLVVTYHPAYLLRSPSEKQKSWQDLILARKTYEKQLSLNP